MDTITPDKIATKDSLVLTIFSVLRANIFYLLVIIPIARGLYRRYVSPLSKYPGPFIASCSRIWMFLHVHHGKFEHDLMDLHQRYGPIVRIAPNTIAFARPGAAKDLFTVGKGFRKTDFYWVFPPPENPDIFTEIREWKHAQMKRFAVTPYSLNTMQKMVPAIDEVQDSLLEKLDEFAGGKGGKAKECDLGDWLHYFAFDVLGEVAFSRRYGFLAQGKDVENCIKVIDDMQWYDGLIGQVPWLDYLFRKNPLSRFMPGYQLIITRMALDEMKKRKEAGSEGKLEGGRDDLLAQLLRAHANNEDKFSEADVFSIAHGAIFAGSDSTASTMQSFFHLLLSHPTTYSALLSEIDAAHSSNALSDPVTYAEAQNLPYFQACLKEAMRLRPAVGLNITRFVPPGGLEIHGTYVPGDVEVAVNGWVLHRDKEVFGVDADEYRPERWLEGKAKEMERHMYQFGGGAHLCIGRNLALLEINKLLPQLLRRYRFELVHPGRGLKHNTTFFVVQSGLEVWISRKDL